jgi:hypothetical protein
MHRRFFASSEPSRGSEFLLCTTPFVGRPSWNAIGTAKKNSLGWLESHAIETLDTPSTIPRIAENSAEPTIVGK